jgi:hypothetical protein
LDIFSDETCPIRGLTIKSLAQQLGVFEVPILGFQGTYSPGWKQVQIHNSEAGWWYAGEWKQSLMQGYGHLYSPQRKMLVTGLFWNHEILDSKCRIIYESGEYYVGAVDEHYQPRGYGQMYYCDGQVYIGEFSLGKPTGNSIRYKYGSQLGTASQQRQGRTERNSCV